MHSHVLSAQNSAWQIVRLAISKDLLSVCPRLGPVFTELSLQVGASPGPHSPHGFPSPAPRALWNMGHTPGLCLAP